MLTTVQICIQQPAGTTYLHSVFIPPLLLRGRQYTPHVYSIYHLDRSSAQRTAERRPGPQTSSFGPAYHSATKLSLIWDYRYGMGASKFGMCITGFAQGLSISSWSRKQWRANLCNWVIYGICLWYERSIWSNQWAEGTINWAYYSRVILPLNLAGGVKWLLILGSQEEVLRFQQRALQNAQCEYFTMEDIRRQNTWNVLVALASCLSM